MNGAPGRPTVGVLVSNYRTWDLSRRCIEEVLRHETRLDSIVVVDDASAEPPPASFGALGPHVRVLVNEDNRGLPATLNRGLAEIGTDLVVVFDSDAYPLTDFGETVRRAFLDPDLAILGFATVDAAGRPTGSWEREPGAASLLLGQRLHRVYLRALRWLPVRRLTVYSCAMALRREAVLDAGGFDEGLDWLDLDHELCMRLRRKGWAIARTEGARAFHIGAGAPQEVSERVLRFYKTRWHLLRKFDRIRHPRAARALILLRLRLELALLRLLGPLLIPDRRRRLDTVAGRERVIRYCREHYR